MISHTCRISDGFDAQWQICRNVACILRTLLRFAAQRLHYVGSRPPYIVGTSTIFWAPKGDYSGGIGTTRPVRFDQIPLTNPSSKSVPTGKEIRRGRSASGIPRTISLQLQYSSSNGGHDGSPHGRSFHLRSIAASCG